MSQDLITIVVTVYNVQDYLKQCLESVSNQTYKNLEIICINDCSTDNSTAVIKKMMQIDSRITLITHTINQGNGVARNTGIKHAHGKYIGFIDGDDWIHPEMFYQLHCKIKLEQADIVQCSAIIMCNGNEENIIPNSCGSRSNNNLLSMYGEKPAIDDVVCNKIYQTSIFTNNTIMFPSFYHEDTATMPRLVDVAKKVVSIKQGLYYYRMRSNSMMHDDNLHSYFKRIAGLFAGAQLLFAYFLNHNCPIAFKINYHNILLGSILVNLRRAKPSLNTIEYKKLLNYMKSFVTSDEEYLRYWNITKKEDNIKFNKKFNFTIQSLLA